jgi:hypothetical protein
MKMEGVDKLLRSKSFNTGENTKVRSIHCEN